MELKPPAKWENRRGKNQMALILSVFYMHTFYFFIALTASVELSQSHK